MVVGGGIAGVTVAAPLAEHGDVTLIDKEPNLAFHTTGRSAALLFETYGHPSLWPLTAASRRFFDHPPQDVVDHPLLTRRGALTVGFTGEAADLDRRYEEARVPGVRIQRLDPDQTRRLCPVLGPTLAGAVYEEEAADMDVAAIHQAFARLTRRCGGTVRTGTELVDADHRRGRWRAELSDGTSWEGDVVVNTAGAWGDVVAQRCGVAPIGLTPLRRTAFMVPAPEDSEGWPLVVDLDHSFYFKPDGVQLLCSPADETPEEPRDTRPLEEDVALAIERINAVTSLGIRHVRSSWAGQRTFAPDRTMVIGPDPQQPSFIWLVGQGGTGIQTAPAAGELAACLAAALPVAEHLVAAGVDEEALSPRRLR